MPKSSSLGFDVLSAFYALLSILPWGFILYALQPGKPTKKIITALLALLLGILSTQIILRLHPIIWPEVDFKPKKTSILSQTVYIAFIQAGMIEETFKIFFIFILSLILAFHWKEKKWDLNAVLISGFIALGFSLIENYVYIEKVPKEKFSMFVGRAIYSSNIHLLINLCFGLYLLKSNFQKGNDKVVILLYAFFLAVMQHGVVDFFLLPSSRFGSWLATAMFVGIWVWVVRDMRKYVYNTLEKEEVSQFSLKNEE